MNDSFDWSTCVAALTDDHLLKLAPWRGYSQKFCAWLRDRQLVGIFDGQHVAFPVHGEDSAVIACHYRLKQDRSWRFFPTGLGTRPLVIQLPVGGESNFKGIVDLLRMKALIWKEETLGAAFDIPRRHRIKRIEEVMETTNTARMKDKFVESLSHGMQQRVGIARTMLHDPQVLILDEPANGLDPQARIEMRDLLIRLAQLGKTLLVTSHILPELSRICDRVAIMTHGKLRAMGTVEEIGRQVSQQRTIEVQLLSPDFVTQAAAIVRRALEPEAEVVESPTEAVVRFRTARTEDQLGDLLSELVRGGIRLAQFREVQTDLEEAFMSFARESAPGKTATSSAVGAAGGQAV